MKISMYFNSALMQRYTELTMYFHAVLVSHVK